MKLYFKHSDRRITLLSEPQNINEAFKEIDCFLQDHNFRSYYKRVSGTNEDSIWIDVGSHTEFFIIEGVTFKEYMEMVNKQSSNEVE